MATPFSFTGWSTSNIAPAPSASPAPAPTPAPVTKTGLPAGVTNVKGPAGSYNTVKAPMVKPTPVVTERVQTGSAATTPGGFSFSGWNSSHLVPKTISAPIVQGSATNIPANAIPVGTGGPATGTDTGGTGVPKAVTDAQSTLETFSNPTLLSFFSNLLANQKGGGGAVRAVATLSPTQEALNKQRLDLLGEPANLSKQLRDAQARQAAAGPTAFGQYYGSEKQRIDNQVIDLQTRLGPATTAATNAGGLAKPYSAISAPDANGIRRNASGWAVSNWI